MYVCIYIYIHAYFKNYHEQKHNLKDQPRSGFFCIYWSLFIDIKGKCTWNNVKWMRNRMNWGRPNQKWWSLSCTRGIPWITACLSLISRAIRVMIACNFVPTAKIVCKSNCFIRLNRENGQYSTVVLYVAYNKRNDGYPE